MSLSARYTTQASAYDRLVIGRPLSDRRIARLQKQGYYNKGIVAQRKEQREKKLRKRNVLKDLLEGWT
jgi:molybdopterin-guanine dinucleotide biosynthesis protein A